jgi:adipocyte-derived leucine aminopeptidase
MENWGLTTYRESSLLFDAEKSSASSKLGITMTVSHELAHQVCKFSHTFKNMASGTHL